MALRIEDYAMVGDLHTAALIGNDGCIDWLCLPRFDSPACFAALLGDEDHGFWQLAPTTLALIDARCSTFTLSASRLSASLTCARACTPSG